VTGVETFGGKVTAAVLDGSSRVETSFFVNAAGPMLGEVGHLLEVELPVYSEVHLKVGFRDHLGLFPRDAPMLIWSDPIVLDWSERERSQLEAEGRLDLLGEMPPGCHGRPEGPVWPLPEDRLYPEVVMKGMTTMLPGLAPYRDRLPQPVVDGGYYTKTRENRPLIGPLPVEGGYVVGALSGFGVMAAAAAGELVSLYVTGGELPDYAAAFELRRYEDPAYVAEIGSLTNTGQI
jgi:glycine/D-amino acid oxidase-like deaminating enzyme